MTPSTTTPFQQSVDTDIVLHLWQMAWDKEAVKQKLRVRQAHSILLWFVCW